MIQSVMRSLVIFRLALSFLFDYLRVRRILNRLEGVKKEEAMAAAYARSGARMRCAALHLQGLIIKVGQFLSARTDILPLAFTRELTQLQDNVPGVPLTKVKPLLEEELGAKLETIFQEISAEPLAAASLGQVHRGVLPNGDIVAVKILRPGIEKLAAIDLSALKKVIALMHRYTKFGKRLNLKGLYEEFAAMVDLELDYKNEASNLKQFYKNFIEEPNIVTPRLYDQYVTRRVLIMEFVTGAKVTDLQLMDTWGVDANKTAKILLDAYLKQILVDGFVHVDPHPGNLLILQDGRVCFLDFGMMSTIDKKDIMTFARLVTAALARDLAGVVKGMDDLGFLQPHANRQFLEKAVSIMLDQIAGVTLSPGDELRDFVEEFQSFLHDEPIIIQAKYMFLGRAIGMATGVITGLYPNIDWLTLLKDRALPMLNAQFEGAKQSSWQTAWQKPIRDLAARFFGDTGAMVTDLILTQATQTVMATIKAPVAIEQVLKRADRGELQIKLELEPVLRRLDRQEQIIIRGFMSFLMSVSILLAVILEQTKFRLQSDIAFGFAAFFLLAILFHVLRHRKKRRRR